MLKILSLFILSFLLKEAWSTHFYGGSMTAVPLLDLNTQIIYRASIRFAWRRSFSTETFCDDSTIINNQLFAPAFDIIW